MGQPHKVDHRAADEADLLPVRVERDIMVEMRDGVRLATDVFHPQVDGRDAQFPILFYRTPYSKDEQAAILGFAEWFARRGYIVVQQNCRGCFTSEGDVNFLLPEAQDGYDTLSWIESQPWGDADVGTWGTSWSAWVQTAMAALEPKRLKTIVPMMSGSDAYSSSVRHGGALELRWIAWSFWHGAENTQTGLNKSPQTEQALIRPAKRFSDWLRQWPIERGKTQLSLTPPYEKWAFDLIEHTDRAGYWDHPSSKPADYWDKIGRVSALYIGSWYDSYTRGSFENLLGHGAKARLIMGAWLHGTTTVEQPTSGGVVFPPEAPFANYKAVLLRWFDRELKGKTDTPEFEPLRLFIMGGGSGDLDQEGRLRHGGKWRSEQSWPLERTQYRKLYLQQTGTLAPKASENPKAARSFRFDPADPVPTIGGSVSALMDVAHNPPEPEAFHRLPHLERTTPLVLPGGFDQVVTEKTFRLNERTGPLADRSDVLVFQTDPLPNETEITGPVSVRLWVSTDAVDTDFTAKLIDVYPPSEKLPKGFALNLTDSIIRLSYRSGSGKSEPVKPNQIIPIVITLYPVGNVFAAGHRIRLDISSSNFPRFDVNPNNGSKAAGVRGGIIATNTIYCDAGHPSHILLPVIPS